MDSFGDTSTVVVHIKRLREKIEFDPKNPVFLETIWVLDIDLIIIEICQKHI
ncbi:winged helix-turn-helix domain-containing protein [Sporosarcina sp. SAFN-015]|uniref:winged helix-turn-helix domain-containing protein n=1 Tax=Sporosarcina sp. SAFN-015 TaxID=3387274 RepID=UPI003F820087